MAPKHDRELFKKMLVEFVQDEDPLLSMLKWTAEEIMKIESESKVGAEKGKHESGRRTNFSGTRVRRFDTRLGTTYLLIPKLRKGGYVPFFVTERKRSELAIASLVKEAFINGVSTRKIERVAKTLGIENISAGQVSQINQGLNEQVEALRTRQLEREYPFVWVDAVYEKVRFDGKVISMAILIAYAVNHHGKREILAVEPMLSESEECWREFFRKLKDRGLEHIYLCVSDAHAGIQAGLKKEFLGCAWQRCKVHFMRNILAHVTHKEKAKFADKLKRIWLEPTKKDALDYANAFMDQYQKRFPEAIRCLESGLEDSLQFFDFPEIDHRKIASTNLLERLNRECRRRTRTIGVFPSASSYIRLISCYLMEYAEDWMTERNYIKLDALSILQQRKQVLIKSAA